MSEQAGGGRPPPYPEQTTPAGGPARPRGGPPSYPSGAGMSPGTPGSAEGTPYATWPVRLGGYLIDAVIFLVIGVILFLVFRHSHALDVHLMSRKGGRRRSVSAVPFLIAGALWVLYGTVLIGGRRGQTVGMMVAGVRAVAAADRDALGYGRAFGRAVVEGVLRLVNLLFFLLGLVWVLDMLFPLWDRRRQTLHDKVVGSVVIRTPSTGIVSSAREGITPV